MLMNGYASGYSAIAYGNMIDDAFGKGLAEIGELTITEEEGGRRLPAGIFARYKNIGA
jgi:hypothetical protein